MKVNSVVIKLGDYTKTGDGERLKNISTEIKRLYPDDLFKAKKEAPLYAGIEAYEKSYHKKAQDYHEKEAHSFLEFCPELTPNNAETSKNKTYFRELFTAYLQNNEFADCLVPIAEKKANPKSGTIKMEEFLGKKGLELYKLALEEEMNSKKYMNAVYLNSTKFYSGDVWDQRFGLVTGGPSGSGKSYATEMVVEKAKLLLPVKRRDAENLGSGNYVVTVDGGLAREVSQMRKLVIVAATHQYGYTGLSDLHKQSKVLEGVKSRVRNTVLKNENVSFVIPETFSFITTAVKLLNKLWSLKNTRVIFARVDGENEKQFQDVVKRMGDKRAWETEFIDDKNQDLQSFAKSMREKSATKIEFKPTEVDPINLNDIKTCESKAYGAGGFMPGHIGSKLAEWYYKLRGKENLSMIVTNDLVLKKPDPNNPAQWVDATSEDSNAILISNYSYQEWSKDKNSEKGTLPDYGKTHSNPNPIKISGEMDLAILMERRIVPKVKNTKKQEVINQKIQNIHTSYQLFLSQREALASSSQLPDYQCAENLRNTNNEFINDMREHLNQIWIQKSFSLFNHNPYAEFHKALNKIEHETSEIEKHLQTDNEAKTKYILREF